MEAHPKVNKWSAGTFGGEGSTAPGQILKARHCPRLIFKLHHLRYVQVHRLKMGKLNKRHE